MAKKFFYVCGGLFLAALSYHLCARSARAQTQPALVGVTRYQYGYVAVDDAGTVYQNSSGSWTVAGHIPGRPVSLVYEAAIQGGLLVGTASGDVYYSAITPLPEFTLLGNAFAGPTPAQHSSWGQVKARYR